MMFIADTMIYIPVLEDKSFSIDCAFPTMDSIINSGIFLYDTKCTFDLILYLSVLMFHSGVSL